MKADHCLVFSCYGARIGIRASHHDVLAEVRAILPPGACEIGSEDADVWNSLDSSKNATEALARLESELHLQVALHARFGLFVHAGVVAWKGRAILIPGRSMSGKSSLVEALVRAGATYYSDEYAIIAEDGLVYPFARPLSLRIPGGGTRRVKVTELGGMAGIEPLPAAVVVSTRYRAGACWRPRAMTAARMLLDLMDNTVLAQEKPGLAMERLTRVASGAIGLKGVRGEARLAAESLLRRLDRCV